MLSIRLALSLGLARICVRMIRVHGLLEIALVLVLVAITISDDMVPVSLIVKIPDVIAVAPG
jgi:hypothetical protein